MFRFTRYVPLVLLLITMCGSPNAFAQSSTLENLAVKTGKTVNKAPAWTKGGTFVYRLVYAR